MKMNCERKLKRNRNKENSTVNAGKMKKLVQCC